MAGRVSKAYGGNEGEQFCGEPPQRRDGSAMGLAYIAGKRLVIWKVLQRGL